MVESADVIVIGSGGLSAATACHLATRSTHRVALLERLEIGSQTSPRAEGMVSIAPALGEMLAAWIVDGVPPIDLAPLSVDRFGTGPWPDDELITQAAWQYSHFYGAR